MGSSRLPRYAPERLRRGPSVPVENAPVVAVPKAWPPFQWPWAGSPRLADILAPDQNSFSVLRLMLALAVLVSHAVFLMTGAHEAEPLVSLTGYSLGQYAVQGFFILSGILVTQSLLTRRDVLDYARARALRIFPALIVCVLLMAFVAGPALSMFGLQGYFLSSGLPTYIIETLTLKSGSAMLPGVFALNPIGGMINQSVWTLKYEVACYLLLGAAVAVAWRVRVKHAVTMTVLAGWALLMLLVRPGLTPDMSFAGLLTYFTLFFGTGVAAYLLRDVIRIAWQPLPVLLLLFIASAGTDLGELVSAVFIGYGLLWLATLRFGDMRGFANQSDYSYGTYLYSYPVTQAILQFWPGINLVSLIAATAGITLVLAFLSWELIERPALNLARRWRKPVAKEAAPANARADAATPAAEVAVELVPAASSPVTEPTPMMRPVLTAEAIATAAAVAIAATKRPTLRKQPHVEAPVAVAVGNPNRLDARMAKIARRDQPSPL
jgi:peptidoglycan/LPS O-acetylase OafA/YrhL